jgi:hypothetical protein
MAQYSISNPQNPDKPQILKEDKFQMNFNVLKCCFLNSEIPLLRVARFAHGVRQFIAAFNYGIYSVLSKCREINFTKQGGNKLPHSKDALHQEENSGLWPFKLKKRSIVMYKKLLTAFFLLSAASIGLLAQDAATGAGGQPSSLALERMGDPSAWTIPDSEATVAQSDIVCPAGGKVLQMTVPVDYSTGQKGYPVGWPRMSFNKLTAEESDWSRWDNFEFMVMVKVSRPELRRPVCSLLIGSRPKQFIRQIKLNAQGEWLRVTVPVSEIKDKGVPVEKIPGVGISVAESDYTDKDVIELSVGSFRLTCSMLEIAAFSITDPVLAPGAKTLKLNITVNGPEAEVKRGVPLILRQKNKVLHPQQLPLTKGAQVYELDISKLNLVPGDYEISLFPDDAKLQKMASFKIVVDPWQQK